MPTEVRKEDAEYALGVIERICAEVGPGVPGSPQERARAMIIREEMCDLLGEDNVAVEDFELAPSGFLGWFRQGVVLGLLALACHALARDLDGAAAVALAGFSFGLTLLILLLAIAQFALCKELVDPLLPKKGSLNVIGRIPARDEGEPKQILLFAGHHDSAYQFTWVRYLKYGYYVVLGFIFWAVLALSIRTGAYLLGLLLDDASMIRFGEIGARILALPLAPGMLFAFFFLGSGKNGGQVPGAADNLSGCCLSLAVGRIVKRHPELIPDGTEIRLVTFGSEEAGMRGARRYVQRHLDDLRAGKAKLFNIETVADPVVKIMRSDCNGLLKSSPVLVDELVRAARAAGVPHGVHRWPFGGGGSDAAAFTEAGLAAACILPLDYPRQHIEFYHQPADNPSVLSIEPFENTLAVAVEWLRLQSTAGAGRPPCQ